MTSTPVVIIATVTKGHLVVNVWYVEFTPSEPLQLGTNVRVCVHHLHDLVASSM